MNKSEYEINALMGSRLSCPSVLKLLLATLALRAVAKATFKTQAFCSKIQYV